MFFYFHFHFSSIPVRHWGRFYLFFYFLFLCSAQSPASLGILFFFEGTCWAPGVPGLVCRRHG